MIMGDRQIDRARMTLAEAACPFHQMGGGRGAGPRIDEQDAIGADDDSAVDRGRIEAENIHSCHVRSLECPASTVSATMREAVGREWMRDVDGSE